jgi:hypothetical protein
MFSPREVTQPTSSVTKSSAPDEVGQASLIAENNKQEFLKESEPALNLRVVTDPEAAVPLLQLPCPRRSLSAPHLVTNPTSSTPIPRETLLPPQQSVDLPVDLPVTSVLSDSRHTCPPEPSKPLCSGFGTESKNVHPIGVIHKYTALNKRHTFYPVRRIGSEDYDGRYVSDARGTLSRQNDTWEWVMVAESTPLVKPVWQLLLLTLSFLLSPLCMLTWFALVGIITGAAISIVGLIYWLYNRYDHLAWQVDVTEEARINKTMEFRTDFSRRFVVDHRRIRHLCSSSAQFSTEADLDKRLRNNYMSLSSFNDSVENVGITTMSTVKASVEIEIAKILLTNGWRNQEVLFGKRKVDFR